MMMVVILLIMMAVINDCGDDGGGDDIVGDDGGSNDDELMILLVVVTFPTSRSHQSIDAPSKRHPLLKAYHHVLALMMVSWISGALPYHTRIVFRLLSFKKYTSEDGVYPILLFMLMTLWVCSNCPLKDELPIVRSW